MMRTNPIVLLLMILLGSVSASATTYYVSPTGNDANSGTSTAQAWRTIARVNQSANQMQPGDRVLFQKGGVYRGTIDVLNSGTAGSVIEYGAYGSGVDPMISGSVELTGWTQHSGNIWKASLTERPKYLFFNGQYMMPARYPNTGWLRVDAGTPTGLTDSDLNQANGHWAGATAVIRTTQWSYDTAFVTASSNGSLTHTSTGNTLTSDGWGYFLRNKYSMLDAPGEWYYDGASNTVYLIAPDGGSPTNDLVEAAVTDRGIYIGWQRHHIRVKDLRFKHHTEASIRLSGTSDIEVSSCTISDTHHGVYSTGSTQYIHLCSIQRTFATGVWLLGSGTLASCELSDIAMVPGEGENNWGYFGIRTSANDIVIADNRINNVGYIGIVTGQNSLIERNVVSNCTKRLNDGGAISFDGADGLIIRDNIIHDMHGDFESIPPQHHNAFSLGHGIYFGNTSIKNTLVENNTVFNCDGNGITVDHTMVSTGNQVKNNVLFNNRNQLGFTDYSNYNGPGAVPPYYQASYDNVISGNVMYCIREDQTCMDQMNVYDGPWVDFGTFSNNYYFNAYNERSIRIYSLFTTENRYMTMERWQDEFNEDLGSQRAPVAFEKYAVLNELSGNLIPNGQFTTDLAQWGSWPAQGVVTRDPAQLDDGSAKVQYSVNVSNPNHFFDHDPVIDITSGSWYRLKFSILGEGHGDLIAGFKGWSQQGSPDQVAGIVLPYSGARKDHVVFFQSDLTDNGNALFTKHYLEPTYWLDNVELHRVEVNDIDPLQDHVLLYNDQSYTQTFNLSGTWKDVDGVVQGSSVTLQPFRSKVIYRSVPGGGGSNGGTVGVKVNLGGAMDWQTGQMRSDLRQLNVLPQMEPYSSLGIPVANAGVSASTAVWSTTGSLRVVDWILLELRADDAGHSVLERRAALVRANGDVIDHIGGGQIQFDADPVGKYLAVSHRNHLGVMAASPIAQDGEVLDMRSSGFALYGTEATEVNNGVRALWPGDVLNDGIVRYSGVANDRDAVLSAIGGMVPTQTVSGYHLGDVNLDGVVRYAGPANDRDMILSVVGGSVPTAVRLAEIP
ncbi:MAG: right-handed parallel beta-helix repeat-containing protein [Flavobacteriales bacterium]|nr:right-handed parallel beta-helix repeat-containing protein [Flavobacteriales bacterium]